MFGDDVLYIVGKGFYFVKIVFSSQISYFKKIVIKLRIILEKGHTLATIIRYTKDVKLFHIFESSPPQKVTDMYLYLLLFIFIRFWG